MTFSLQQLTRNQLAILAASMIPPELAARSSKGSLPPAVVARRALGWIEEGKPEFWCASFLIVRDADQQIVGGCGFKGEPQDGRVEIAYGVGPENRRQGAASAAVAALLKLAFAHGAREVVAEIVLDNLASAALVEKLGFYNAGTRVAEDNVTVSVWVATSHVAAFASAAP